jgi:hypothetical protein
LKGVLLKFSNSSPFSKPFDIQASRSNNRNSQASIVGGRS